MCCGISSCGSMKICGRPRRARVKRQTQQRRRRAAKGSVPASETASVAPSASDDAGDGRPAAETTVGAEVQE